MGCVSSQPTHPVKPSNSTIQPTSVLISPNALAVLPDALSQPSELVSPSLYASQYNDSSDNIDLMSPTSAAAFSPPVSQAHTSIITDAEPTPPLYARTHYKRNTARQRSVSHAFSDAQHACVDDEDETAAVQHSVYSDMDVYAQEFKNTLGLQPNKQTLHYDEVRLLIIKLHIPSVKVVQSMLINILRQDPDYSTNNAKLNKVTYAQLLAAYNDVVARYSMRAATARTDESQKRASNQSIAGFEHSNNLLSVHGSGKSSGKSVRRSLSSKARQAEHGYSTVPDSSITRQLQYQFSLSASRTTQTVSLSNAIQIIRSNYHPPARQIDTIMNFFDCDNNRVITEAEFINAIKKLRRHREMKQRYKGKLYEQSAQAKHVAHHSVTYSNTHADRHTLHHDNELSRMSRIDDSTNRQTHVNSALNSMRRLSNVTQSFVDSNDAYDPLSTSPLDNIRSINGTPHLPQKLSARMNRASHTIDRQTSEGGVHLMRPPHHRSSLSYAADGSGYAEPMSAPASVHIHTSTDIT